MDNFLKESKSNTLSTQSYLKTNLLTTIEKQTLFGLRSRNFPVKSNYKSMYDSNNMTCRICQDPQSYEDEIHTFQYCKELTKDLTISGNVKFHDIYEDLDHQICAMKNFMKIINKRNLILELRGL